jgi:hypothetical protein
MAIPNDTAPEPIELVLPGGQEREIKAPAAVPPIPETEMERDPSSWRATNALATA